ncbi:MAG: kelch repeat-containing protein [Pseudomonadota bacterium]
MIFSRRTLLSFVILVQMACTSNVGQLTLSILHSSSPGEEPLDGVAAFVRIRIDGPDGRTGPKEFPIDQKIGVLSDAPVGEGQVITVEGLGAEMNPVSRGRTGPLTIKPGQNKIELFVGLLENFSHTPLPENDYQRATMQQSRAFHGANLLQDGTVLFTGGTTNSWRPTVNSIPKVTRSAERINGNSLRFEKIDCGLQNHCMHSPRLQHSATLLPSGNVLIAGGTDGDDHQPTASTEIYFANNANFLAGPDLESARLAHGGAIQRQSTVLAGGVTSAQTLTTSVESFEDGALRSLPALQIARHSFALILLDNKDLMACGGFDEQGNPLASTEFLAPGAARWRNGPSLNVPRAYHTATLLFDGTVLLVGGLTNNGQASLSIELFDPNNMTISEMGDLHLARWAHTTNQLLNGKILVAGGFASSKNGSPTSVVEEITIEAGGTLNIKKPFFLRYPRAGHTATLLQSGMLLITGGLTEGKDGQQPTDFAEVFIY